MTDPTTERPLERLLTVQEQDTRADQLRHRLATLPERDALAAAEGELARLHDQITKDERRSADLERMQRRHEDEVASVEAKVAEVDKTLYSGTVSAPKELQALQDEIAALGRHKSGLEDRVLGVMEELEPVTEGLVATRADATRVEREIDRSRSDLATAEREIAAELEEVEADRRAATDGVPEAALAAYERLRQQMGGIAIAKLDRGTCQGCHLRLSAVEVDRIKKEPDDAVIHCEECGRMLVH